MRPSLLARTTFAVADGEAIAGSIYRGGVRRLKKERIDARRELENLL